MKKTTFLQKMVTVLFLLAGISSTAQITVTSSADSGAGTLRQAVADVADGGAILFDTSLNGSSIMLTSAITISKNIIINGNGNDNTMVSGSGSSRIFTITAGNITMNNLTLHDGMSTSGGAVHISGGTVLINNCALHDNEANGASATEGGGAIYIENAQFTLNASTLMENHSTGTSGSGGAILAATGSVITVNGTVFTENTASRAGGAIEGNGGSTISLNDVTLEENTTGSNPGNGGGLHITGAGNTTINDGLVTGNTAASEGGGLWNGTGTMTIDGTVITGNTASGDGPDQGGGGIYNLNGGTLSVINAEITNNIADGTAGSGGGILNDVGSMLTITDTEISGNTAIRAGGGIEDNSGTSTIVLTNVNLTGNSVTGPPGNGGGLHITGAGSATITGGNVTNNTASLQGGGLWNGSGTMTINDVDIQGNVAEGDAATDGGGGVFNVSGTVEIIDSEITENEANGTSGSGGGIFSSAGNVTIVNSEVNENTANRAGGGIEIIAGVLTVNDSELNFNETSGLSANPGNGGGLHVSGAATVVFNGGEVSENVAGREGGGLWNQTGSTMTLNRVTVDGNIAQGTATDDGGGGIFNNGGTLNVNSSTIAGNSSTGLFGRGGGIHINAGTANIMLSTISGNTSVGSGGGIYNNAGLMINANTITLNAATISGGGIYNNSETGITLKNTIAAGNLAVLSGRDLFSDSGMIGSDGYNLVGMDDANDFDGNENDWVGTLANPINAGLLELADNGGDTHTHALDCPSAAADMGDPDDSFNDQNDMAVFNDRRDIGAFEAQEACSLNNEEFVSASNSLVYPNPSLNGNFNLQLSEKHGVGASISIYEIATGKLVKEVKADSMQMEIGMANFATGTYVMQIVSDNTSETHKLIAGK